MTVAPERLYKYQTVEARTLENMKLRTIWFSSPARFNDPFDCGVGAMFKDLADDDLKRAYDYYMSREDIPPAIREQIDNDGLPSDTLRNAILKGVVGGFPGSELEERFRTLGVACFSEAADDMLMWAHYADGHRGFCLEFDASSEPFSRAEPVVYRDDLPLLNPVDVLDDRQTGPDLIEALVRTKHTCWSYEREWRLLHEESDKAYTYPFELLTGVYFGASMPSGQKDMIGQLLLGSPTRLYEMKRGQQMFSVTPSEVTYTPYGYSESSPI